MSIADVTARITQIQQQLQTNVGVPGTDATTTSATSSTDFATALYSAVGRTTTDASVTSAPATASQQAVLDEAEKYLGVPYQWGGTDPSTGLDCSGFTQLVYKNLGYDLPRVSSDQATAGTGVAISGVGGLANAQPGDLLAFGSPVDHIAIYAGDGKMVEAPHTGANVRLTDVWATPTSIRRILPDQSSVSGVAAQLAAAQQAFLSAYNSSLGSAAGGLLGTDALGSTGLYTDAATASGSYGSYLTSILGTS